MADIRCHLHSSPRSAASLSTAQTVVARDAADEQFGKVHFSTSCNELAQRRFDRAMRYQHSFWYRPAKEIFEEALAADPECAIAQWGIALSLLLNPHVPPPKDNLALGLATIEKARSIGGKTQRERDYIDALLAFYTDHDKVPHARRVQAYLKAMEGLAARYPDDDEAQIGYAIMLNVAASPNDKTYANQLKGAAILEPIFKRQPRHPGIAHYLIHLYDYPPIAEKGLRPLSAMRRSRRTPECAAHAISHFYEGRLLEGVRDTNAASADAAKAGKEPHDQLHAMDYQVYAHLQMAQDKKARAVADEMVALKGYNPNIRGGPYAVAASQARYAIERGDWTGAADLKVEPTKFAYVDAITHFARALGAARSGDLDGARADIGKLTELRDKLYQAKDEYWSEQVDIQRQVATAWVLHAEGKFDEALTAMSVAAESEDKTEKSIVTPGPLAPARELYGQMLLDRGMAREALAAFEATKAKEPNRFHGYAGAAMAADKLGDKVRRETTTRSLWC